MVRGQASALGRARPGRSSKRHGLLGPHGHAASSATWTVAAAGAPKLSGFAAAVTRVGVDQVLCSDPLRIAELHDPPGGANVALIADEIVQFTTADLIWPERYRFQNCRAHGDQVSSHPFGRSMRPTVCSVASRCASMRHAARSPSRSKAASIRARCSAFTSRTSACASRWRRRRTLR